MIDTQLLKNARNKDRKAQNKLYRNCFNFLMSVCIRYKKEEKEAAAILNQGFLKILNNLDKYREEVPFGVWIRRIMINTIIDEFRKNRKVRELIEYKDFSEQTATLDVEFQDYFDLNEADKNFDAEDLETLIKKLPPVSQKVFNLFAIDGYSHKEIGKMLGISDGTSKWHLSFARKKIQEMMKLMIEKEQKLKTSNHGK